MHLNSYLQNLYATNLLTGAIIAACNKNFFWVVMPVFIPKQAKREFPRKMRKEKDEVTKWERL